MLTTILLKKQNMKFAAAHFTIFSATERERLHGHNYYISCALTTEMKENGLSFDYRIYKKKLETICRQLDHSTLIAQNSKPLRLEEEGDYLYAHFNGERIPFLRKDVTLLPLCNVTVEELSRWIVSQMLEDKTSIDTYRIEKILVRVYSGPGQSGSFTWKREGG